MVRQAKVVIIGGGFGGLRVARRLKGKCTEVILIDRTNHHLFQPLLYQVAGAALSPADIAVPIRHLMRGQANTVVIMGNVILIDKEQQLVRLESGETVTYDYLVVSAGANHSYFGHPEWEEHAPGIKNLVDALSIRERMLLSFENAERSDSISAADEHLNFVVIGGGPTGVEVAGAIAEIAYKTMIQDFRRVNSTKANIYLIEGLSQLLPSFPPRLAARAQKDLEHMGVKVLLNKMVTNVTAEGVQLGDQFLPSRNVIWAAGNQAAPLLKTLNVPLDRQGRVVVEADCTIPGHPEVFVIGDAACFQGKEGKPLPAVATVAIQQGQYVADMIAKGTPPGNRKPFKYLDKGMMATIGTHRAVAVSAGLQFTGYFAWLLWGLVHIAYLIGFRNRAAVMMHWMFTYWGGHRGARLITRPIKDD